MQVCNITVCVRSIFSSCVQVANWRFYFCDRYLNDSNYYGGFDEQDLVQLFSTMKSNFQAWVSGFAPAAVGADLHDRTVQEFSRTLFSMRSDVALSVGRAIFYSDLRSMLPQVTHTANHSSPASLIFMLCQIKLTSRAPWSSLLELHRSYSDHE